VTVFGAASLRRTLTAALRDVGSKSAATRAAAIGDLTAYVDESRPSIVAALERAIRDDAAEVRAAAAVALADVGAVEALSSLLVAVEDGDAHVRQMAMAAIGEIGDPRARERLRRALSDDRPEVRFQAIIAFSRVAPDESTDAILRALDDPDANVRYVAIRCAEERTFCDDQAMPAAFFAKAASLLEDPDTAVRIAVAIVLARSGDRRGEPILLDVVRANLTTTEAEDEAAAVELCGELGIAAAEPHLERRAFGFFGFGKERFAWQALVSLGRLGHARARSRIVRDLSSRSRDRRTLAVVAAGRARLVEARALIEEMKGDERQADADAVALALEQLDRDPPLPPSEGLPAREAPS
jgi:HEAT repeat protein